MTAAFVYQTIHTLDGRPFFLAEHITALDAASRALFDRPFAPRDLEPRITALLSAERLCTDRSIFVRIELDAAGELRLTTAGISLYRGYALRSLCPEAVSLRYDIPFGAYPTSARESLAALALTQAARQGARCVVRCNCDGMAVAGDDAPLFAVKGKRIYTSPALPSAERTIAERTIVSAGLKLCEEPIMQENLPRFDELFSFDHRGITTFSRCDEHPYMSIIAERVAQKAAQI